MRGTDIPLGGFCLVLHGHLPYVLRHGRSPHGVDWLYEAVAETYLPLLNVIDECAALGARAHFAMGLTPVLIEQLTHEVFVEGFHKYLAERRSLAEEDLRAFEASGERQLAGLARKWADWYEDRIEQFERLDRDVASAFARHAKAGSIEVLSSAATHAYLPLLCEDSSVRAQLRAGLHSTRRILKRRPAGLWLPECAYRPRGPWEPPVEWEWKPDRIGLERLLAEEGITHCFLDHHMVERGRSEFVRQGGSWKKVDWEEAVKYSGQGWRSVHEVHGIYSDAELPPRVFAFARDPKVCEQVWSGTVGYPAHGSYLEFHKHRGPGRGLRYWRITSKEVGLGDKEPYEPERVAGPIHEQAQHFAGLVAERLQEHRDRTGRSGLVTAAFDAELFGHWWFEGPQFLRDVLLTLHADPRIELVTPAQFLERHPPDKILAFPEGSWGEGGDHRVWSDARIHWMWDIEYRCESRFRRLVAERRDDARIGELLRKAGRELLLLQASDWPFAITRGQAVDYGIKRFVLHVARFDSLVDLCSRITSEDGHGEKLNPIERHAVEDADLHDVIFSDIDLDWWLDR
jgi:1,4-alpha-glucan branching enzyme